MNKTVFDDDLYLDHAELWKSQVDFIIKASRSRKFNRFGFNNLPRVILSNKLKASTYAGSRLLWGRLNYLSRILESSKVFARVSISQSLFYVLSMQKASSRTMPGLT